MEEYHQSRVVTSTKKVYTVLEKIFCCRCFNCLQDVTLLTSDIRKQTLQRMIKNYVISEDDDHLYDPLKLMILIYLCEDTTIPQRHIQRCRLNPNVGIDTYRTDLEFYIPQICNSLVFHLDLKQSYLLQSMQKAGRLSFYFGHLYYFYIQSLEKVIDKYEIQVIKKVSSYKDKFLDYISNHYEGQGLTSVEFYTGKKHNSYPTDPDLGYLIKTYGTNSEARSPNPRQVQAADVMLPNYSSIFRNQTELFSFKSTLNFFEDLFTISQQLKNHTQKKAKLEQMLMIVNQRLPACVYIPFSKSSLRLYNVVNIVSRESRVFSTKQRAPFYICVQAYCPAQALSQHQQLKFWQKVQTPITLKNNLKTDINLRKTDINRRNLSQAYYRNNLGRHTTKQPASLTMQTQILNDRQNKHYLTNKLLQFNNQMRTQPRLGKKQSMNVQMKAVEQNKLRQEISNIFGQEQQNQRQRIRSLSIYSSLQTWTLIHLMIKTNDNLKQQQFAIQLIYEFYYIFKLEKIPLILTPYQVLSMGPDCGIIEMVKDAITIDSLKRKMKQMMPRQSTLKQFFELYYGEHLAQAKDNFVRSLAAYSLVMYFLQVKDRHNGNIMLHRSGKILHIDFGFFLSNMPGKGVELEKDVPFKLLTEYIEVLDGTQSHYFKKFRQYLFLGFKAAIKHQNKILILVKMMYSSSGTTMPCFEKGQAAIKDIETRFNPPDSLTDSQLNLHCQKLIDSSLDNWAAKWYDRWQYWAQGIVY